MILMILSFTILYYLTFNNDNEFYHVFEKKNLSISELLTLRNQDEKEIQFTNDPI